MWWPERNLEKTPLEENEAKFMHTEQKVFGVCGWNAFNELRNSSTRTEIGASLLAMIRHCAATLA